MAKKYNKNDQPLSDFKDIKQEIAYDKFSYKDNFFYLCDLKPQNKDEKLVIINTQNANKLEQEGVVYIFVINKKIVKIGSSISSIKGRINSYNTGKRQYRMHGTNSTTNYFILQSILNINKNVKLYAYFPKQQEYEIFGEQGQSSFPPPKMVEKKILTDFKKQFHKLPIFCTQR